MDRRFNDLKDMFLNSDGIESNPLIYEFNNMAPSDSSEELLYGVTILYPGTINGEYYMTKGHVAALTKLLPGLGVNTYNLGTGNGYSVMDVLHAYESACGKKIPYKIEGRRPGDIAIYYCNADKAKIELNWTANKTLEDMCVDSWRWQRMNPNGYNFCDNCKDGGCLSG